MLTQKQGLYLDPDLYQLSVHYCFYFRTVICQKYLSINGLLHLYNVESWLKGVDFNSGFMKKYPYKINLDSVLKMSKTTESPSSWAQGLS